MRRRIRYLAILTAATWGLTAATTTAATTADAGNGQTFRETLGEIWHQLMQDIANILDGNHEEWRLECENPDDEGHGRHLRLTFERVGNRRGVTFQGPVGLTFGPGYHEHEPWTAPIIHGHPDDGGPRTLRLASIQDAMVDTREWVEAPESKRNDPEVVRNDGYVLIGAVTRRGTIQRTWVRVDPDGVKRAYHWTGDGGPAADRTQRERTQALHTEHPWPEAPPQDARTWTCDD